MNRKKILISIILLTAIIILLIIALNPITIKYNRIAIDETEWNSIISARTENKDLKLEDIKFDDYNLIIDETNNKLYFSVINENKDKYDPKICFSASDKNTKIAVISEKSTEEIRSNYEYKLMIYNNSEYHIYNLIFTNFPILNISYKEDDDKLKRIPMEMYLFDNLTNMPNKITISTGKLKINEKNITFSLNMTTPGNNTRESKISILNMKPSSEYVLTKLYNNEDLQNNKYVELFINNEYQGLYVIRSNEAKEKQK